MGLWIAEGLDALIGGATWALPAALVIVGALMVARSDLVDVRPFRTGLFVLACGLMITLGKDEGGYVGTAARRRARARARRRPASRSPGC